MGFPDQRAQRRGLAEAARTIDRKGTDDGHAHAGSLGSAPALQSGKSKIIARRLLPEPGAVESGPCNAHASSL
jgi:hypothetical protein